MDFLSQRLKNIFQLSLKLYTTVCLKKKDETFCQICFGTLDKFMECKFGVSLEF